MGRLKSVLLTSTALAALMVVGGVPDAAKADYLFTGSGANGFLNPVGPAEPWHFGYLDGNPAGWGSPGVSYGETPYSRSEPAYGMDITFSGGDRIAAIRPGSVAQGNASACVGSSGGGTTFCTSSNDIWEAFQTGPDSIQFLAQSAAFDIVNLQNYFVNVLFSTGLPAPTSFSGKWLTEFSPIPTPEPASLALLGTALAGFGAVQRRRRKRKQS